MQYRGIRYTVRARIERNEWTVSIHPAGIEGAKRVVTGARERAELVARSMIDRWRAAKRKVGGAQKNRRHPEAIPNTNTTAAHTRHRLLDALLVETLAPDEQRELEAAESAPCGAAPLRHRTSRQFGEGDAIVGVSLIAQIPTDKGIKENDTPSKAFQGRKL